MAYAQDYLDFIVDQLVAFGRVTTKKMFGGVGIFHEGNMFAMQAGDTFRLKVDDGNQADYEVRGIQPFQSGPKKKGKPYWQVPADVIEDPDTFKTWTAKADETAVSAA